ncbi:MAG: hypothetical protein AB1649_21290 [Chloroflexota bacterium]
MTSQVDYDLHGIVGIRLLNATPKDIAVVTRQLGPIQSLLAREPDIVIRFVDQLRTASRVRYLGLDDVGFTDDAFLVLHTKHHARVKVQIPFEKIGQQCEIICERGLPAIPLIIPILNITALKNGALPLHASAFNYRDLGIVMTGWSKGGKTETLLAFMANGAEYVGDEWVYLSGDGQRMFGIPQPIRIWDWHLDYLSQYRALLGWSDRTKLRTWRLLADGMNQVRINGRGRHLFPVNMISRILPLLKKQTHVDWPPEQLFGQSSCSLQGTPDKIFFVASHEAVDVTIQPIDPQIIAQRMVFSLQEEQMKLISYYRKFRFAFPTAANELIEQSESLQRQTLARVLSGKDAYAVYHPYPVPIQSLFDTIRPYCN